MDKKKSVKIGCIILIDLDTNETSVTSFSSYSLAREKYEMWLGGVKKCRSANVKESEEDTSYTYEAGGHRHKCILRGSWLFNHSDGLVEEQLDKLEF